MSELKNGKYMFNGHEWVDNFSEAAIDIDNFRAGRPYEERAARLVGERLEQFFQFLMDDWPSPPGMPKFESTDFQTLHIFSEVIRLLNKKFPDNPWSVAPIKPKFIIMQGLLIANRLKRFVPQEFDMHFCTIFSKVLLEWRSSGCRR